jgi:oligoendopeptidase F
MTDVLDTLPKAYPRAFVPADLAVRAFEDVEPLYRRLLDADLSSVQALEKWVRDRSELEAIIGEFGARVYIRSTLDTTSAEYKQAFLDWVEKFEPRLKPLSDQLDRKYRDTPARKQLDPAKYGILDRSIETALALFREQNIPLQTDLAKLSNEYEEIIGGMSVEFDGAERTLPRMSKYQLVQDQATRESAWRAVAERRAQDAVRIDELYDKQLKLRQQVAANAGHTDFRSYMWKAYERFSYTPEDCTRYADSVEKLILPVVERLLERRRREMKLETLRPWDLACDPQGRPPLKPFDEVEDLKAGCERIFSKVDPELGNQFTRMRRLGLLDLDNRKGKAPGGYQSTLYEARLPFIFMNAVGVDDDVTTLLHEGGHSFHSFASATQELLRYRDAPIEFAEVASMSMELLGMPHIGEFYDEPDAARSRRQHLEGMLLFLLPWVATIDQFQHWVYTHPGHTAEQRKAVWLETYMRFDRGVDHRGVEQYLGTKWQRQNHLFTVPFYYIEYAIAQIGALQVWLNSKRDQPGALAAYRDALALGGSRELRDLFKAAGLKFGMDTETLKPLVEAIEAELEVLS